MEIASLSAAFDESGDFPGVALSAKDYVHVPGWPSLEAFLKGDLGITSRRALESFRNFYNQYLKRFPVHYFSGQTIPGIEFALFFPIRLANDKHKSAYYLVAMGHDNKRMVLFHRNMPNQMRTRTNFYYLTKKWKEMGAPEESYRTNIKDILYVCENPEDLIAKRKKALPSYLKKLQYRLKKQNLAYPFEGKWDRIQKYLEDRDREFICKITARMKSEHVDFEVAKKAAEISDSNLHIYNWIMAGGSPAAVRNRMQVVEVYPWLAQALAIEDERRSRHSYQKEQAVPLSDVAVAYAECERAIDEGERLPPVIQDVLTEHTGGVDVSQSAIRKTMGLRLRRDLREPAILGKVLHDVGRYLDFLDLKEGDLEVIHDVQKEGARGFSSFNTNFAEMLSHAPPDLREAMMGPKSMHETARDIANTADYMHQVYARLVLPYFAYEAHRRNTHGLSLAVQGYLNGTMWEESFERHDDAFGRLPPYLRSFGNMRTHNIVKLSVEWHKALGRYSASMRGVEVPREISWPALLYRPVVAPNDIVITCRNSKKALEEEHRIMGHCIDGYTAHCLGLVDKPGEERKYVHIVHLAAKNDPRIKATFAVEEPFNSKGPRRVSAGPMDGIRIRKDTWNVPTANSPVWAAARWLVEGINDGSLKVDWERIDQQRRGMKYETISAQTGFDPTVWENCVESYRIFRPFLPERFRHYVYEAWVEKMGFARDADVLFREGADLSLLHLNRLEYAPGG